MKILVLFKFFIDAEEFIISFLLNRELERMFDNIHVIFDSLEIKF